MVRRLALGLLVTAIACSGGGTNKTSSVPETMKLTSSAFADNGAIPKEFTCEGANQPPPLAWSGVPPGTTALALVMEDIDAKFLHWVFYGIDPSVTSLPSSVGAVETRNDFGKVGYGGPCPRPGTTHHYVFTIYALPGKIGFPDIQTATRVSKDGIDRMPPSASGKLTGTYKLGG